VPTPLKGERTVGPAPPIQSKTEFLGIEKQHEEKQPIVKENVHKKVIEEVTPVVMREVTVPHVIEETKHIYEKVEEQPVITHEVREPVTASEWKKKEGSICQTPKQNI